MSKTIEQALSEIADPEIRARELENRRNPHSRLLNVTEAIDCEDALSNGFVWMNTEERDFFWANVHCGNITTWQQACEKYPHLRELPLLSDDRIVTDNTKVIQHAIELLESNGYLVEKNISEDCEHPYAFVTGEEHGNPKCSKCGKVLL